MNRFSKLTFFAAALLFSFAAKAQTAEEIISKYLAAVGGEDKLRAVKAMRIKAKVNQGGMDIPLDIIRAEKGKNRTSFVLQGREMVQTAFDGEKGWVMNFMTQKAEPMETEDIENLKREGVDFPDPFVDYQKKGYKVSLEGKEKKEGVECFKVKLVKKPQLVDGQETENEVMYYFDSENYVPILSEVVIKKGPAKGKTMEILMGDYQEVEGLMMPFSMTQRMDGNGQTVVFDSYELNPKLDEKLFAMPGK